SKRLGSLSVQQLRAEGCEPMAISSLLAKLGTSDPVEVRTSLYQLASEFSFSKMGRAPARFDEQELANLNASLVHGLTFEGATPRLAKLPYGEKADATFWEFVKGNLASLADAQVWLAVVYGEGLKGPELSAEDKAFISAAVDLLPKGAAHPGTWKE